MIEYYYIETSISLQKGANEQEDEPMKRLAAFGSMQLSLFAQKQGDKSLFTRYSRVLDKRVTAEEVADFPLTPDALFFDDPKMENRYQWLYIHCLGEPAALTAIGLYLLALMEEETIPLLQELFSTRTGLTVEMAGRIAYPHLSTIENVALLRSAFASVHTLLLAEPSYNFLKASFILDGRLAAFLMDDDRIDWNLAPLCTVFAGDVALPPSILMEEALTTTQQSLENHIQNSVVVLIRGKKGSGKEFFVKKLVEHLGGDVIFLPISAILEHGKLHPILWQRLLREMLLSQRMVCITQLDGGISPEVLCQIQRDLSKFQRPFFLCSSEKSRLLPALSGNVIRVAIPTPSIHQGSQLWQAFALEYLDGPADFPARELAAKMNLTAGQIQRVVQLLALEHPKGPWDVKKIFQICYQVLDDGSYQNVNFVNTTYTIDDLKLEVGLKKTLEEICAQVAHQEQVLDGWGLRRKFPYGRSVSVLFSGPPGTGKTMSAQVLASMLRLELYQIDLSQVVDKYIGETEKRLSQVFDQAEKSNMILFFDEADALLGKRSEVKDSKDKHANTEVSFLLQRIEQYNGIVIMATNQPGNMDRAFLRRFRYHLVFTLPDVELRRALWQDVVADIPQEPLDWDYLAEQFELSGALIKNIALNGAYRAANDDGVLKMHHVIKAIDSEQKKEGHLMVDLGQYAGLLEYD